MFKTFLSKTPTLAALLVAVTLPACAMDATSNANDQTSAVGADDGTGEGSTAAEREKAPEVAATVESTLKNGGDSCVLTCALSTPIACLNCRLRQVQGGGAADVILGEREHAPDGAEDVTVGENESERGATERTSRPMMGDGPGPSCGLICLVSPADCAYCHMQCMSKKCGQQ